MLRPEAVPIGIGIRKSAHIGYKRAEPTLVRFCFVGHRHCEQRPTMEGVLKDEDRLASRVSAGDLHSVLHCLGPAVEEGGLFLPRARRMFA